MKLAQEHQEKIFDMFYRIDDGAGGEGIGLSVVKRMVERNGGRIWLVSEKDKGSNFFLALPLPPNRRQDTECRRPQSAGADSNA